MKKIIFLILGVIMLGSLVQGAKIELDGINFDPAIIAAGDEVDILIQYHIESVSHTDDMVGNPDYNFIVRLKPDDSLTEEYVIITDSEGDDAHGTLYLGDHYNKVFRIKVKNNAVTGNYQFKLEGIWEKDGEILEGIQYLRFDMPVKKEGIILDIATLETVPSEVRPGDNYVKIVGYIENVGEKSAKSVEVNLGLPDGIESSYSNNNRIWVGGVNAGEKKELTFFVDVDEKINHGIFEINYDFNFMDYDNNEYNKTRIIPFLIKPRPYIEVTKVEGEGLAGETVKLRITVKNTGSESAESVDLRIIKQNTQPFDIDVRSDYIGELEPGEEGVGVFDIKINRDAEIKEHDFKIIVRSKGDTDEGDDNIYTYNRRAKFDVIGQAKNPFIGIGIIGAIIVLAIFIYSTWRKKK